MLLYLNDKNIEVPDHVILLTNFGSTTYNLRTKDSDHDYRGCYLDDRWETLLGIKSNDLTFERKEPDLSLYNLIKFIHLALNNNTNIMEPLFVKIEHVVHINPLGQKLRDIRKLFVNDRIIHCLNGYFLCEYQRALRKTTGKLGEKRKEEIKKLGYSPKNASHCIRLLDRAIILLETGVYFIKYDDDNPTRELLLNLKQGNFSKELFETTYLLKYKIFAKLKEKPYHPSIFQGNKAEENRRIIWNIVRTYLKEHLHLKLGKEHKNGFYCW